MKASDFTRFYQLNFTRLLTPLDDHTGEADSFFNYLARRIKTDFDPETVLDIGCGDGSLVLLLRREGIQAWGIDFSDHVDFKTLPEVDRFCRLVSPQDIHPVDVDLVVCLETLASLDLPDAERLIQSVCSHTKAVLSHRSPSCCQAYHLEALNRPTIGLEFS